MGGMVATRFASTYPEVTSHVVFVNQIGLTDTRPGRPWTDPADSYPGVLETTYESVLRGHVRYYPSGWRPEYLEWVKYQYGLTLTATSRGGHASGPHRDRSCTRTPWSTSGNTSRARRS